MRKAGKAMNDIFRKELKYVITQEQFWDIKSRLGVLMEQDEHSTDGSYMVRSQYYDSITDADLKDNLDGVWEKQKIRVRVYSPNATVAKLEYKCKKGSDGIKYSMQLNREEVLRLENHQYDFLLERKEELAHRLYVKMTEEYYRPKTIIEYRRTAFLYPVSDVRITFDRNLRASSNPYGILEETPGYFPLLNADKVVMEIKYNDFLPTFLKEITTSVDASAEAYSKYSIARLNYIY